jgi:hypothetical protein
MVAIEVRSGPLRFLMDPDARESIIRDRITTELLAAGEVGVAVNCGANHAQKTTLGGPTATVVGTWLAGHPEVYGGDGARLRSIAFAGARGSIRSHYYDTTSASFDVVADGPENSLLRIVAEHAGDRVAFLPLRDPLFSSEDVLLDMAGTQVLVRLGLQYDGLVLYPRISVLRSLGGG